MIRIEGRAVTFGELWFDEEPPPNPQVDVLIFRQRPSPIPHPRCTAFLTLVHDLGSDEEELAAGFTTTTKYQIRRAETKDRLKGSFTTTTADLLEQFSNFYDAFAAAKSVEPAYRRGLAAASAAGQLVLTAAHRDDEVLVRHAYVVFGNRASLLYSASHFREKDQGDRAVVGRANRWLHWQDMLEFKRRGLEHYDWGGLFQSENSPEAAGINRFKTDFGGRKETTYNCTSPLTLKGRSYLWARDALNRVQRK